MMLVDSSVALKWFLDEADSAAARLLLSDHVLVSPALVLAETGNGLWKAWRRSILSSDVVERALATLPSLFAELAPIDPVLVRAGALSRELDHPVYDCIYLATAERLDMPLVTADQRLRLRLATSAYAGHIRMIEDVA